jgi:hypothetical protein
MYNFRIKIGNVQMMYCPVDITAHYFLNGIIVLAIQNKQSRETEGDNKEWTNQRNCHHRAHKTQDVTPSK